MAALLLGLLLSISPADSTVDRETCIEKLPVREGSNLLVSGFDEAAQTWSDQRSVSTDTLRTLLSEIQNAQACFRRLAPSEWQRSHQVVIFPLLWESHLHAALRDFPKAFEALERARIYLRQDLSGESAEAVRARWLPQFHTDEGYLHYLLGDLSASIEHYVKAYEATPERNPVQRARSLIDIGILHQRTQDYRTAHAYYDRAERLLASERDTSGEQYTVQRARSLSTNADLLLEQTLNETFDPDRLEQASALARRTRALADPETEPYIHASIALSESLGYLGHFERAYALNEDVRRYARTHGDARRLTFALLKLGVLHVQTERWSRADSVFQEALARAEELGDLDYQRRILRDLGRLHEMQEQWSEAEHFYREGVAVVEEYRQSLTASQWSMTAFAQWRDVYRGLVRTLLAQDRPREALVVLDRSRARHLQDLRTQARVSTQLSSKKRTRLDSLSRALTDVRNRLGKASGSEKAELRNREAALMAARQQLIEVDPASNRPALDAVAETLAAQDRVLVSYFLDDPWPVFDRRPRSVAFLFTGDSLRTVSLPGLTQDSVRTHVEAISPLFASRGRPNRANAMHFDLRPLHELHDAVYAPVAKHLPANRSLTVIPDGPLFHVPFSMLVRSMPNSRFSPAEARYVLHERPVAMELASSLVADTTDQTFDWSRFDPQMAAYGVSEFDTLRSPSSALRSALPRSLSDSSVALPSLPGVRDELDALESTVPDAQVALNDRATEAAFCRSVQEAGVLHVASHTFVNPSSPLQNAILLRADSTASSSSDGVLFLHELQGQRARIPMVVLSGCDTASGTLRGGEGMEGLQYAFRAMGAQSTVSTLWPVADQSNRLLMEAFYQGLQDGLPKDEALRQAQLQFLREHPDRASPFFWAPPVLYGSPGSLPLEGPLLPVWTWWLLGVLALLVLLGLVAWGWSRSLPPPFCHGPQP
jgi:CHAT domain-containing protein